MTAFVRRKFSKLTSSVCRFTRVVPWNGKSSAHPSWGGGRGGEEERKEEQNKCGALNIMQFQAQEKLESAGFLSIMGRQKLSETSTRVEQWIHQVIMW